MRKTKMLSMLRDFSMKYAPRYSNFCCEKYKENSRPSTIQKIVREAEIFRDDFWETIKKSTVTSNKIKQLNSKKESPTTTAPEL